MPKEITYILTIYLGLLMVLGVGSSLFIQTDAMVYSWFTSFFLVGYVYAFTAFIGAMVMRNDSVIKVVITSVVSFCFCVSWDFIDQWINLTDYMIAYLAIWNILSIISVGIISFNEMDHADK